MGFGEYNMALFFLFGGGVAGNPFVLVWLSKSLTILPISLKFYHNNALEQTYPKLSGFQP